MAGSGCFKKLSLPVRTNDDPHRTFVQTSMTFAPIALFAYNRPGHLKRTVEALRSARHAQESRLWIFCDGPKRPEDSETVAQVRTYARSVRGFETVTVVERERNFGLAASVTEGVRRLCDEFGRVIVVEDDLIVSSRFLDFLNQALDHYEEEEKVMQVSGYMYPGEFGAPGGSLFLPMISCWGWATWKRAWEQYDPAMTGYEVLCRDRRRRKEFDLGGAYDYFDMLKRQVMGKIDSWGICWHLSVFMQHGLVLYPTRSMVRNIGVDGSGTHGGGTSELQRDLSTEEPTTPVHFPKKVEIDEAALSRVSANLRAMRSGLLTRLIRRFVA